MFGPSCMETGKFSIYSYWLYLVNFPHLLNCSQISHASFWIKWVVRICSWYLTLVSCLARTWTPSVWVDIPPEYWLAFDGLHILESRILHNHFCGNIRSYVHSKQFVPKQRKHSFLLKIEWVSEMGWLLRCNSLIFRKWCTLYKVSLRVHQFFFLLVNLMETASVV